jgi:hypothetical protein
VAVDPAHGVGRRLGADRHLPLRSRFEGESNDRNQHNGGQPNNKRRACEAKQTLSHRKEKSMGGRNLRTLGAQFRWKFPLSSLQFLGGFFESRLSLQA